MAFTHYQITHIQKVIKQYGIKYCTHCEKFKILQEFAAGCRKERVNGDIRVHIRYKERCKSCSIIAIKKWRNEAIMTSFNYTTDSRQLSLCL